MHAGMDTEDSVGTVSAKKLTRAICGDIMTCRMWTSATIGGSVTLIRKVTTTIKNAVGGSSAKATYLTQL